MNQVRYVSADMEWSDSMKQSIVHKIVEPLERHLKHKNFDLAVHLTMERKRMQARQPHLLMSLTLNTHDGKKVEVVHGHGDEFFSLVNTVSNRMRTRVRKH
ncbi:MAG: hypothetical protein KF799_01445 [Bdellovibrionales bacterium]|nr:hypothetical protein [Bdellovibrionales bacterium]